MPDMPNLTRGRGTPVLSGSRQLVPSSSRFSNAASDLAEENQYSPKEVQTIDFDLGTVVDNFEYQRVGTFLWYGSAVDASNVVLFDRPIFIRFNRANANPVRFLPGMALSGIPFDKLYLTVPAGYTAGELAQLVISTDGPDDRIRFE